MIITANVSFAQHMQAAIGLAAMSSVLWSAWALFGYDESNGDVLLFYKLIPHAGTRTLRLRMLILQASFIAAAMLEIFDFPPFAGVFDAHSLWHAATVPLGFQWYSFLIDDGNQYLRINEEADDEMKQR